MNLKLISALNRARLRRKVAQERARRDEMHENAQALLAMQDRVVIDSERAYEASLEVSSADIARRIDRREKAALLAAA